MDREFKKLCLSVGKIVADQRKVMGISQEELAHLADIDRTYVSQIERGVSNPSLLILHKVAQALKLPVSKLLQKL